MLKRKRGGAKRSHPVCCTRRLRSSGTKKSLKEEALDKLKAMGSAAIETKPSPPSPVQALLGSIAAGVIALIPYKFTLTIEAALNRQTVSHNFSTWGCGCYLLFGCSSDNNNYQVTSISTSFRAPSCKSFVVFILYMLVCRTIVNGLCYLATFVVGINSLGLFLYSGQLAINSFMEDSTTKENESTGEENLGSVSSVAENAVDGTELTSSREDQSPDDKQ
ncbi:Uncharacterized protein TCM_031655 [Theobroma cacao]|uniref:Uncharacterized protein n=1 Tax=Theobroma cacao TaxID=3641 RepID=A0A061F6Z7_THECC|nr:Uncharacterized protein TCM_031655 [Theobroma cacao]